MGEDASETVKPVELNPQESWLVQGLHDGRIWAEAAASSDVREFALNEEGTLPTTASRLAVEYRRRFPDFQREAYHRAWEAAVGLAWLRRRGGEERSTRFESS